VIKVQLQAYQGYYENGYFHVEGRKIQLPVRRKMTIIFEDNFVQENKIDELETNKRLEMVKSLRGIIPSNIGADKVNLDYVVTRDDEFLKLPNVISPNEFLSKIMMNDKN